MAEHEVAWVGNSQNFFFLGTFDGRLLTMRVSSQSDGWSRSPGPRNTRTFKIESYPSAAVLVLEGSGRTAVFANREFVPLFDGDAVAVRTFMNSRWYRYLVAVVGNDGVALTALVRVLCRSEPLPANDQGQSRDTPSDRIEFRIVRSRPSTSLRR